MSRPRPAAARGDDDARRYALYGGALLALLGSLRVQLGAAHERSPTETLVAAPPPRAPRSSSRAAPTAATRRRRRRRRPGGL